MAIKVDFSGARVYPPKIRGHNVGKFPDIDLDYTYRGWCRVVRISSIEDFRWIKSVDHLKRVNRYRKRVGQWEIVFSDDDMFELIMLTGGE